jgi:hypothetical protein
MELRGRVRTGGRELYYRAGCDILVNGGEGFVVDEREGWTVN